MGIWDRFTHRFDADQVNNEEVQSSGRREDDVDPLPSTFPTITLEILQNLPDRDLVSVLTKSTVARLAHESKEARPGKVKMLPVAKQAIYLIWTMDQMVIGHGWEKFHLQYWLEFISLIPEALQMIGASRHEALVEKAVQKLTDFAEFDFRLPHSDMELYLRMKGLDREYELLSQTEKLDDLMIQFIRQNPEAFVDR